MKRLSRATALPLLAAALANPLAAFHPADFEAPLDSIAFGSCNRQNLPQPLWPVIASNEPDLWIWGGDNIYGDSYDAAVIADRYAEQLANENYRKFRAQIPIIGTWDDHDYGWNNADATYPLKATTAVMALDFMEVPEDDPRRKREGIYGSYDFGPPERSVRVVLIDNRYFATGEKTPGGDLLGAAQQAWLERTLLESEARINLVVSGSQVLSAEHRWDKWANFPKTREWLLDLIVENEIEGVVFLSGDRHIHEISELQPEGLDYPLVDVTSSGLTHSWESFQGEPNSLRLGEVFTGLGFGLIRIDWSADPLAVVAEIRDKANDVVLQHRFVVEGGD